MEFFKIGMPVVWCGADGGSVGVRSRDYQIFAPADRSPWIVNQSGSRCRTKDKINA